MQDNELLQAQVDEADYWIYDRGIVAEELYDLRLSSSTKDREIDGSQERMSNFDRASGVLKPLLLMLVEDTQDIQSDTHQATR